ncbi:MAG: hypothetical protein HYY46_24240 [Deltaproteobacteria bacterium]|nr:hypothetical protein [Deltaproteobacteria bacterium]
MHATWVSLLVWVLLIPEYWVPAVPGREDLGDFRVGKWASAGEFPTLAECERFRATTIGITSAQGALDAAARFHSGMCLDKEEAQKYLSR